MVWVAATSEVLTPWIQLALTLFGIVGFIVLGWVYTKGATARNTITLLRQEVEAQDVRIETLEEDKSTAIRQLHETQQMNKFLEELKTGTAQLTDLQVKYTDLALANAKEHQAQFELLRDVLERLLPQR
jgi:hypothetical protein